MAYTECNGGGRIVESADEVGDLTMIVKHDQGGGLPRRYALRSTSPVPLRRDIAAVVAATRPPTGAAQALLDLLAPAAALGEARARSVRDLIGACQPAGNRRERQQGIEISRNFPSRCPV